MLLQAVHASEIAECAETQARALPRGAKCSFTMTPEDAAPLPLTSFWLPPWAPKFTQNRTCARSVRKGARKSAPERKKTYLSCPKGAKRCQNGAKMEANGSPKCAQNRGFEKKVPKVVWTHYLLYILTTGTLRKPHFLTPRSKQNAGLFRVVPRMPSRGCKMAPTRPKTGVSGPPGIPKAAKGSPNAS